jgi:hypothetical protein
MDESKPFGDDMDESEPFGDGISIFQLKTDKWILQEYNLAGIITKRSYFMPYFKDKKVLAVNQNMPHYLVTPLGMHYLRKLWFLQITEEHEVKNGQRVIDL